jgi:hypothetical protein
MSMAQPAPPVSPGRGLSLSAWCVVAAFGSYFCMYAFRKPFTAGAWKDMAFFDIGFKTILVTAQVLGYTLSKFLGIKVIAEVKPHRRAVLLLGLIAGAQVALLLFALTPAPFNGVWLFVNGIPLGMVFGLVLGFLEGRRHTEALAAGLCASFILADGVTKSAGAFLLQAGVSESWMPFTAGLLFVPPLLFFVWMLTRIPLPSNHDVASRSERAPLGSLSNHRRAFSAGLGLAFAGTVLIVFALLGLQARVLSPLVFMILIGLGLYLPYIVVHTTIFERLLAMTRERGNIGYLMYLADSFGYLGYVAVLIARNLIAPGENFLSFFVLLSWATAGACMLLLVPCYFYFANHPAMRPPLGQELKGVAWAAAVERRT